MIGSRLYISPLTRRLGWAGLAPQLLFVGMIASRDPSWYFAGLALAACYGALILSFLGGIWWGLSLNCLHVPRWTPIAAVLPSLVALGSFLPWLFGFPWPRPSLVIIAFCLVLSPLVDRGLLFLEIGSAEWIALRLQLSAGLGLLTLAAALL